MEGSQQNIMGGGREGVVEDERKTIGRTKKTTIFKTKAYLCYHSSSVDTFLTSQFS